ncbi:(2Fe-2S)-binding protein [Sporolactobacillus sp. THM7-7]|nr:(2Fe-2S)-binding protein [Sporolactobacillus sp. THM7-7]
MVKINYLTSGKEIEAPENSNILRMSLRHNCGLPNRCGGGLCGTCVFKVEKGAENLDRVKIQEKRKLGQEWLEKGYRLGCQTFVTTGDVALSWDKAVTQKVKKRKPGKYKSVKTS